MITFLILLVVLGVVLWLIEAYLPMAAGFKIAIRVVVVVIVVLALLSLIGYVPRVPLLS